MRDIRNLWEAIDVTADGEAASEVSWVALDRIGLDVREAEVEKRRALVDGSCLSV
jgi:hypothetical protein